MSLDSSTVFVTGGAGFIGSAFVRLLLERFPSIEVIIFDALTYAGNLENLKGLDDSRLRFVHGDITDTQAVRDALPQGAHSIVNFASESHVDRSITSANEFILTNILGTQVLLDAARTRNVGRFIQVSTDEVMGSLPEHSEELFTEHSEFRPNSPYAAAKAAAEHFVRAAHKTFGLDVMITRCGNNYGPRQFPEKLIPLAIANALGNQPVPVYGDGLNIRDWIYVEDHCEAILRVLENGRAGSVYSIGARNARKNLEVIKNILDALGKPHSLIQFVKDRLGHDRRYAIDPSRIETELNWRPRNTWESGLEKTIQWYKDNSVWLDHVRSGAYREYYERQYGTEVCR